MLLRQPRDSAAEIPPWAGNALMTYVLYGLKLHSYVAGVLVALLYWVTPLLFSIRDGTALSAAGAGRVGQVLDAIGAPQAIAAIAARLAAHADNGLTRAYLEDGTHFCFSLIISVGAVVAVETIKRFDRTVIALIRERIPCVDPATAAGVYMSYREAAFRWSRLVFSGVFGLAILFLIVHLSRSADTASWWGNHAYGAAGTVFAAVAGLMVFGMLWGAIIMVYGSLMLKRLMTLPIELRPFHRDNCNGLAPLGRQIMMLWSNALLGGLAIYVTLRLGYVGIERSPFVWALALFGTLAILTIAIVPLYASLGAVRQAQGAKLDQLGISLERCLEQSEAAIGHGDLAKAGATIEGLGKVQGLFDIYRTVNVWPFNPRALTLIVCLNAIQVALTVKELYSLMPK
jgi:hypothetical protein